MVSATYLLNVGLTFGKQKGPQVALRTILKRFVLSGFRGWSNRAFAVKRFIKELDGTARSGKGGALVKFKLTVVVDFVLAIEFGSKQE